MKLGEALKKARKDKGLSMRQLATVTRLTHSQIYKIENGVTGDPGFHRVIKLAKALGLDLERLAECGGSAATGRRGAKTSRPRS